MQVPIRDTPTPNIFPPLARDQPIETIIVVPHISLLHIRLLHLGVCDPFVDLIRDRLLAKCL